MHLTSSSHRHGKDHRNERHQNKNNHEDANKVTDASPITFDVSIELICAFHTSVLPYLVLLMRLASLVVLQSLRLILVLLAHAAPTPACFLTDAAQVLPVTSMVGDKRAPLDMALHCFVLCHGLDHWEARSPDYSSSAISRLYHHARLWLNHAWL